DSVEVFTYDLSLNLDDVQDTLCINGDSITLSTSQTLNTYTWEFNGTILIDSVFHFYPRKQGTFTIYFTGTSGPGCIYKDSQIIVVEDIPIPDYETREISCSMNMEFICPNCPPVFTWVIDSIQNNSSPYIHTFKTNGKHEVQLIYQVRQPQVCVDTLSFEVDFDGNSEFEPLYVNVFTPDEDGINDCFHPDGFDSDCAPEAEIKIFDRWGVQVYQNPIKGHCWNGRNKNSGELLSAGVYYYYISYILDGKTEIINGVVHLIK